MTDVHLVPKLVLAVEWHICERPSCSSLQHNYFNIINQQLFWQLSPLPSSIVRNIFKALITSEVSCRTPDLHSIENQITRNCYNYLVFCPQDLRPKPNKSVLRGQVLLKGSRYTLVLMKRCIVLIKYKCIWISVTFPGPPLSAIYTCVIALTYHTPAHHHILHFDHLTWELAICSERKITLVAYKLQILLFTAVADQNQDGLKFL